MRTPKALIVEDVADLATIFTQALNAAGYDVTCLDDGYTAQLYLAEYLPDLLVLDLHLPNLPGDQLLNQLREDMRYDKMKIIIVTADARRGDELREEADLVLQKPVSFLQLRDLSSRLTAGINPPPNHPSGKAAPSS